MSNTPRWNRLEALLEVALDAPTAERPKVLADLAEREGLDRAERRELDSLLAAAESEPTLLGMPASERLFGGQSASEARSSDAEPPEAVGPYRLLEPLGQGGMGTVYLAQRTDGVHSAKVAVKLLRLAWGNLEIERRFHVEREILASLDHPAIARLLDGGSTDDGRPYLVMEWVDGQPIDRWCATHEATIEQRLRLFVQVCRAVDSAHRRLVVHRDLKPSNILVDRSGQPKLLDFGIAKLLDGEAFAAGVGVGGLRVEQTATGLTPLTPAYASPEQVRGEAISTAADVYALGVLLHELLCGRRPHEAEEEGGPLDLLIAIREHEPTRPSSLVLRRGARDGETDDIAGTGLGTARLARRLRGDLDQILLHALDKDASRRYPSAEQLAADIERHLEGHPVAARPASWPYTVRKFVGRHRLAVAATATAVALLVGSLVALLVQRQATLAEARRAELTTSFLVDQLHDTDPFAERAPRTVRELLDRSVERLASMEAPDVVRADLETAMGRAYLGIGELGASRELLQSSLDSRLTLGTPEDVVATQLLLSEVDTDRGFPERGVDWAERALAVAEDDQQTAALLRSGYALMAQGDLETAESRLRRALDLAEPASAERAELAWVLGMVLAEDARYDEAARQLAEALAEARAANGAAHPSVGRVFESLGILERLRDRFDLARSHLDEAEAVYEKGLAPDHPHRLGLLIHRASVELRAGQRDAAEQLLLRGVEEFRRLAEFDGPKPDLAEALDELGSLYGSQRRFEEARPPLEEALAIRRGLYGDEHPTIAESQEHLALLDARQGDYDSALERLDRAGEIVVARLGPDHPRVGVYLRHQGNILYWADRNEEAVARFDRARRILEPALGQDTQVGRLYNSLAVVESKLGRYDSGRRHARRAIEIFIAALGETHRQVGLYRNNLARLELEAGDPEAACREAEAAREIFDALDLAYLDRYRARNEEVQARCWIAIDRSREAEELISTRLERTEAAGSVDPAAVRELLAILIEAKVARGLDPAVERARLAAL